MNNKTSSLKSLFIALALGAFITPMFGNEDADLSPVASESSQETDAIPRYLRERTPKEGEGFKFFLPALSWRVKSIALSWDCSQGIRQEITKTIGSEEETEDFFLSGTGFRLMNSRSNGRTVDNDDGYTRGHNGGIRFSLNPLVLLSSLFGDAGIGGQYDRSYHTATKHIQASNASAEREQSEDERKSARVRNYMSTVAQYSMSKELTNFNLVVEVEFTNNTGSKIIMEDFSVPVFSDENKLGDAFETSKRQRRILQPRKGKPIPIMFRCELDNTRAISMLSGNISVDIAATSGTLTMPDGADVFIDVIDEDRRLFISDGSLTGVLSFRDDGEVRTVRDFLNAVNAQCSRFKDRPVIEFDKSTKNYLKAVCGNTNDETGFWSVCVPAWRNRPLALDEELPQYEDVVICKTDKIKRSWIEKAADDDKPDALYWMGVCWERGIDGAKDLDEAVDCFEDALGEGFLPAEEKLADIYLSQKKYDKVIPHLRKLAERGNAFYQNILGVCYYRGSGVERDFAKAFEWQRKSAMQGNPSALSNVGWSCLNGKGVERDISQAFRYFVAAVRCGDDDAHDGIHEVIAVASEAHVEAFKNEIIRLYSEKEAPSLRYAELEEHILLKKTKTIPLPDGVSMGMCYIPAGTFTMGSPSSEQNHQSDENQVQVALSRFALGQTEVTQAQWKAVMGNNPSYFKGDNLPVETVSWDEAMTFCRKLTELARKADLIPEGFKFTLPTEAQWEYACRAGTTTRFSFGNADSSLAQYGNFYDKSGDSEYDAAFRKRVEYPFEPDTSQDDGAVETNRVASYRPNAWGLYDMHGNVWEWCLDYYNPSLSGGKDPVRTMPGSGQYGSLRVNRGGSWFNPARDCRSANRSIYSPGNRNCVLGFRVALVQSSD